VLSPMELAKKLDFPGPGLLSKDSKVSHGDCRAMIETLPVVTLSGCKGPWFDDEGRNYVVRECAEDIERTR